MAVGILGMLTLTGTTLIYYTNTNARSAEYSGRNASAYDLAEAGINEMMAVLSKPENNALMPDLLPSTTHTYTNGRVTWSGTLDQLAQTWSLTSTGRIKNPTGNANDVLRTLTAKVPVTPTLTQPLNNPAWNYIYSTKTGSPCDMTIANNVSGSSRLYVEGNLCLYTYEETTRDSDGNRHAGVDRVVECGGRGGGGGRRRRVVLSAPCRRRYPATFAMSIGTPLRPARFLTTRFSGTAS